MLKAMSITQIAEEVRTTMVSAQQKPFMLDASYLPIGVAVQKLKIMIGSDVGRFTVEIEDLENKIIEVFMHAS